MQEQRFRSLQAIDKNIHSKIDNSLALMNNLVTAYQQEPEKIKKYVQAYSKEKFTLIDPVTKSSKEYIVRNIVDSGYLITVNNINQIITLKFQKQTIKGLDTAFYQMSMQLTFNQFTSHLLPENVFDEYVIFSKGEVVYETFPSGITSLRDTSLVKSRGLISSTVSSINASGRDYKLFLQPVSFTADQKWVVAGLLSDKRYQQEKNQLPSNIVLLLVTAMLIIMVSFPWIKLYQMGNKDRLTISDGIASIVVAMLLMSLLFFSFFKYNRFLRPEESFDSKAILANQITTALESEIDSAYQKLKAVDSYVSTGGFFNDVNKIHAENNGFRQYFVDSSTAIKSIIRDTSINQVFWLTANGEESVNWIGADMNAPHGNFSNRDYFKNIIQRKSYLLNYDTAKPYFLDQVISWVSGKFTTVISIPSGRGGQALAAMSFNMKSIDKPVLPTGYHFAIINNSAKVLYHADVTRNLNENLLTEFSESEKLTSCMKARTDDQFTTNYFSKEYNVLFKPLKKLPYSIVIFSDLSYKEARDMEIYSFTISMLLLLFAILILQLLIVFLVSSKKSFFKNQLFNTTWIGPKKSSFDEYNVAIIFNLLIIFLVLLFYNITAFLAYVYILLFSVTFMGVFLNQLFKRRYHLKNQVDSYRFKKITVLWLIGFILILNITALKTLDTESTVVFFTYELLSFIIADLLYSYGDMLVTTILMRFAPLTNRWDFSRGFALMSLTRLIITSGIPVAFFYISSYNYDQNISVRYRQLQYADQLLSHVTNDRINTINNNTRFDRGFYNDSAWIHSFAVIKNPPPVHYSEEDSLTAKILGMFRINFTAISTNDKKFYLSHASDSSFFYNPLLKDATKKNRGTITYRRTEIPGTYLKLTASSLNYKSPAIRGPYWMYGLLFWLLFAGTVAAFYFIIYNILIKLFCLRLHDLSLWKSLDEKILNNESLNHLIFIIGLPGAGKLQRIKEKIRKGEMLNGTKPFVLENSNPDLINVQVIDLINIPDFGSEKERNEACEQVTKGVFKINTELVIVNHFEYNMEDIVTNRIKLNFLEKLMLEFKSKVIILSTIHPIAFLDSVFDGSASGTASIPDEDLQRWHVLLGHYRIVIFSLDESLPAKVDYSFYSIMKETQYTHFLKKMQPSVLSIADTIPESKRSAKADQLAFKLQVTSHYFYMYIWQSLTKEEKFLLYDLAEDNLVNSFDNYNLNMLLAKGVIICPDGTLQLFNKGFRNFILTAIGNSEAMKIKNRMKDNGNWSSLRNPLLIVLLAILTFLLTFQEEAYSKIIAFVAALGTGVPLVIRVFSIFDKNSGGKT